MRYLWAFCLSILFISSPSYSAGSGFGAQEEQSIFIVGSTTVANVLNSAAPAFYQKTGIKLVVRPIGSDKGVVSIAEEVSDLGIISRHLTPQEQIKYPQLTQISFGQDAIVLLVNKENPINSVNRQQVANIFTGKKQTWHQLSKSEVTSTLSDKPIVLLSKGKRHGTHAAFLSFFQLDSMKAPNDQHAVVFKQTGINHLYSKKSARSYSRVHQAVGQVSRMPEAIAYESYGAFKSFSATHTLDNIKALELNNVAISKNSEINKAYPLKRPLNIIVNKVHKQAIQDFIDFMLSEEGQTIVKKNHFIAL